MPTEWRFAPRVAAVPGDPPIERVLAALAGSRGLVALDSAGGSPARASLVAFDPLCEITRPAGAPASVLELRALAGRLRPAPGGDPVPGPFHGGFLGALAYDLGPAGERPVAVPDEPFGLPLVQGGLYTDFVVRDELAGRTWLVLGDEPGDGRAALAERRERVLARLARAAPRLGRVRPLGPLVRCVPAATHRARIEAARAAIAQGEIYQANIAHRFVRALAGHPLELYLRLRRVNPAPFMAYLEGPPGAAAAGAPSWALLSASPELLLEYDGRTARTRPIKGTIARAEDPALDRRRRAELRASAKDLAELTMIVDLERNDLGRVARPGGVWVEDLARIESYPALHHLVADVVAETRAGVDACDVLAALFPGGSISGVPKLRALEIIAEQEGEGRGFFSGSLGFLDTRGRASFNILIRTLVWRAEGTGPGGVPHGQVSFRVGGGITWSSDAAAEEAETLVKAERLLAALAADGEPA